MTDQSGSSRDRLEGALDKGKGNLEQAWGDATGDDQPALRPLPPPAPTQSQIAETSLARPAVSRAQMASWAIIGSTSWVQKGQRRVPARRSSGFGISSAAAAGDEVEGHIGRWGANPEDQPGEGEPEVDGHIRGRGGN